MDYSTNNESDMASATNSSISLFEEWLAHPVNETDSKLCQSDHTDRTDHADPVEQPTPMSSDIMNMNVSDFIIHYGVLEKETQSTCVNDIRNLIFAWMGTIDITHYDIHDRSLIIFEKMASQIDFKQFYSTLDTYN